MYTFMQPELCVLACTLSSSRKEGVRAKPLCVCLFLLVLELPRC